MKTHLTKLMLTGSMIALSAPAFAQQAEDEGLGEIIVTANRVETSAQDTPIALNVYSGDALADQGVNSVRDLATVDPSINITSSTGSGYVAIRGIASTDTTEIGDPSVPVARDGFYTNRSFSLNSSMYDVARIEVLKGPQGTLNGRNSTGGMISIITNRPKFENGGYASFEAGNFETLNGEIGANIAFSDSFAVRASGTLLSHKGYRKSAGPARSGDDENFASGRIQANFKSGGFSAWASYQHDSRDVNGDAQFKGPITGPVPAFGNAKTFTSDAPTFFKLTGDRFRWELGYEAGSLNFIYAGGYDKQTWRNALDGTSGYPATRQFRQSEAPKTWNHEFRVSNNKVNRLFFQAGYFRFKEKNTIDSGLFNLAMTGPFAPGGFLSGLPNADQSGRYGLKFDYNVKTQSQAVFGQVEYDLSDQLEIALGGRYTWDKKDRTGQAVIRLQALAFPLCANSFPVDPTACPPFPLVTLGNGKLDDGQASWHVGLNYRPNTDTLIYARYDRGYKAGGFNSNGSAPSVNYGSETLDAFELGAKNTLSSALQLNLSAFYYNYRGYQASQSSAAVGGGNGTFNVGNVKLFGAEGSLLAKLGSATRLNVNASYIHTKFGDNILVRDGGGTTVDISGNELPNAPGFSASAGIEQSFAVGSGKLTARVDGKYSSSFYYSAFNTLDTESPSYVLANASLGYEPANGIWKIQAFVRNIFDKEAYASMSRNYGAGINTYQFQAPRTFGVRGSFNF